MTMDETLQRVKATVDFSHRWFLIPNERMEEFGLDLENDEYTSVIVKNKWEKYAINCDLHKVPLFVKVKEEFLKVTAIQDDSYHWYLIPFGTSEEFFSELKNVKFVDSGKFDDKWREYMTGGGVNLVQLYVEDV